jgi:hypothetical protein
MNFLSGLPTVVSFIYTVLAAKTGNVQLKLCAWRENNR